MGIFSPNIMANSFICCAKYNAEHPIVIYKDQRITWEKFTPRICRIAQALIKLGVKKNDKVAFMFHNTPEFIEINKGIHVAGAIPAPMNYRFIPREVEYQGNHCDAEVFLYDSAWADAVEAAAPKMPNIKHFICKGKSALDNVIDYEEFVNSGEATDPGVATDWADVAVMIYTGGTTGAPKGVMLTYGAHLDMFSVFMASIVIRSLTTEMPKGRHQMMLETFPVIPGANVLGPVFRTKMVKKFLKSPKVSDYFCKMLYEQLSKPEVARKNYHRITKAMYPSLPFFHDASYSNLMIGSLMGNLSYVLPEKIKFDPAHIMALIEREKVKNVSNVPTGWKKLVSFPDADKYDLSSVRIATTGGGVCSASLKKQILEKFPNTMILDSFGQTEMTPITSFKLDFAAENIKDRSVGKSIVEAKIVDEEGNEVSPGQTGEILYRSNTVMKGYYKEGEKTREVMRDGWFHSGDLGYFDETGEIRVVDRKKECINSGGEKIFPLEVEEIIIQHPQINDVCVIGVPDEEWGNIVRAVVVLKNGKELDKKNIVEFCRGDLAGYKIPRSVVFIDELPYSPVGKLLRQTVRDLYGKPG